MTYYKNLDDIISERGVKKTVISKRLNISRQAFNNKISGESRFTVDEALSIKSTFFPDLDIEYLFADKPIAQDKRTRR